MSDVVSSGAAGPPLVICLGEAMAQVIPSPAGSLETASTFSIVSAGAESNVAISLSRLGTRAGWAGRLGDDPLGHRIVAALRHEGVDTHLVHLDPLGRTGVFFKDPKPRGSTVYYCRDGSAASCMNVDDVQPLLDSPPTWIHLSGITAALSPSCEQAVRHLLTTSGSRSITTSYDVNFRPMLWANHTRAAEVLRETAEMADVVFVGLDEAHDLWGTGSADEVRRLLARPAVLVVKDAGRSAVSFEADTRMEVPARQIEVVEPVGAGDAFAAGWIHARLRGLPSDGQLRMGHLVASAALKSLSDYGRLPMSPQELERIALSGDRWAEDHVGAEVLQA